MNEITKVAPRLSRFEVSLIVLGVVGAWFLGSLLAQGDWAHALGNAVWGILLGFGITGTINKRWKKKSVS